MRISASLLPPLLLPGLLLRDLRPQLHGQGQPEDIRVVLRLHQQRGNAQIAGEHEKHFSQKKYELKKTRACSPSWPSWNDRDVPIRVHLYFLTCLLFCIAEFLTLEPWRKFRREGEKEEEEGRILAELLRKIDRSYSWHLGYLSCLEGYSRNKHGIVLGKTFFPIDIGFIWSRN